MPSSYARGSNGIVFAHDITKRNTFTHLGEWIEKADKETTLSYVRMLIGNKSDLIEFREVSMEEGEVFARKNGMIFFEASALTGSNVQLD